MANDENLVNAILHLRKALDHVLKSIDPESPWSDNKKAALSHLEEVEKILNPQTAALAADKKQSQNLFSCESKKGGQQPEANGGAMQ